VTLSEAHFGRPSGIKKEPKIIKKVPPTVFQHDRVFMLLPCSWRRTSWSNSAAGKYL
jgi:hypothetical protein